MSPDRARRVVRRGLEGHAPTPPPGPRAWQVVWQGEAVLDLEERPGTLRSTAPPPPGWRAPEHPFIDAVAIYHRHEHALRGYVHASNTARELLDRLFAAGYDLAPPELERWDLAAGACLFAGERCVATVWAAPGPLRVVHAPAPDSPRAHALTIYDAAHGAPLGTVDLVDFDQHLAALGAIGYRVQRFDDAGTE